MPADSKGKEKGIVEKAVDNALSKGVEEVTSRFLGPILTYIGTFCSDFSGYVTDFDGNVDELKEALADLNATGESLRTKVKNAQMYAGNKEVSKKVEAWYTKEEMVKTTSHKLMEQIKQIKQKDGRSCLLGNWCAERLCHGKNVVRCFKRVKDAITAGEILVKKDDQELLEQRAPGGDELLNSLKGKFQNLGFKITNIDELHKEVERRYRDAKDTKLTDAHKIAAWLKNVTTVVNIAKSLRSNEAEYVEDFRRDGSGSTSDVIEKVKSCIDSITGFYGDGETFLKQLEINETHLASSSSSSSSIRVC